jgi:hypothetical protein
MEVLALREAARDGDPPLYDAIVEAMDVIAKALHLYLEREHARRRGRRGRG